MSAKDEEILSAWAQFFVSHALSIRSIETEIAGRAPLTLDEYDLLLTISRAAGQRIRFSALAKATVYTRSGITRITKRLESEGHVRKEPCADDKRGSFAILTDSGKKALNETWKFYGAAVLNLFGKCFTQAEAAKLRELLGKLADQLSEPQLVQIRRIH